jgi:SNF2 family DNA or RNA helicase
VQSRLIALHHLDAPWKPAEVEQREGRILRQGNDNPEVAVYGHVTEGSFDAYMRQALETKARFIARVMTGDNTARRAEDIGGQELSYAEVKAIASGNPAVLTLAEADPELQRLNL